MTRSEIVAIASARGFTAVKTYGGHVALGTWHPYGAAGAEWQGEYIAPDTVRDVPRPDAAHLGIPVVLGVWHLE